jgi:hypothetical protein
MRAIWKIITGILLELSDESAYRRHLAHHGRAHSREEWRLFSEERLRQKFTRARCC